MPPLFQSPIEREAHFQNLWRQTSHAIHHTHQRVECFGSEIEGIAKEINKIVMGQKPIFEAKKEFLK